MNSHCRNLRISLLERFRNARIYGVAGLEGFFGLSLEEIVSQMLQAGLRLFQYRNKTDDTDAFQYQARKILALMKPYKALFIINDRVDIALELADGVHLGQKDMPLSEAIACREKAHRVDDFIIGLSTSSYKEAKMAIEGGADYFNIGPIFQTRTKPEARPLGLERLSSIVEKLNREYSSLPPFSVMGGIQEKHFEPLVSSGAKVMAMISELGSQKDIQGKTRSMLLRLEELIKKKF